MAGGLSAAQTSRATQVLYRLQNTAQDYISKYCKGSILGKFPSDLLQKTGKEIMDLAKTGNDKAQTAQKLLTDTRFAK